MSNEVVEKLAEIKKLFKDIAALHLDSLESTAGAPHWGTTYMDLLSLERLANANSKVFSQKIERFYESLQELGPELSELVGKENNVLALEHHQQILSLTNELRGDEFLRLVDSPSEVLTTRL